MGNSSQAFKEYEYSDQILDAFSSSMISDSFSEEIGKKSDELYKKDGKSSSNIEEFK
jgi:hypothetical protein